MTSLIIGAALYHLSFIFDCIDGKLARLKGNGTVFGGWLDYVFDRIRVLFCALALMGGQYLRGGDERFLLAALMVVFLDMLRYVDALQIYKMRMSMRTKIEKVTRENKEAELAAAEAAETAAAEAPQIQFMEDLLRENPEAEAELLKAQAGSGQVVDLHAQFRHRFPWYLRVRQALLKSRIRPHLISGIEFQMFIFIVGPLIGQILWTTLVSAILLGIFELIIMYKFWLSTRDFTNVMAELTEAPSTAGSIAPTSTAAGTAEGSRAIRSPTRRSGLRRPTRIPASSRTRSPTCRTTSRAGRRWSRHRHTNRYRRKGTTVRSRGNRRTPPPPCRRTTDTRAIERASDEPRTGHP